MRNEPEKLLIYGTSNWSKLVFEEIRNDAHYEIVAFACDQAYYNSDTYLGIKCYRFETIEEFFPPDQVKMLICGMYRSARARMAMYERACRKGYSLTNFISARALVADSVAMGVNNFVFGGAYLDCACRLGNCNIIRPNVYIGHDARLGDGVYIAPGCNIAGFTEIGDLSFIGLGSNIVNKLKIGREVIVGAGSLVLKDAEDFGKYLGSPARLVGKTDPETGYLLE